MRFAARLLPMVLQAVAVAVLGAACSTTSVRIEAREGIDFAAYRTWGWESSRPPAAEAPVPEQEEIARNVARVIAEEMRRHGFAYVASEPDLQVSPRLEIRRRQVVLHWTRPDRFVPSLHSSPSYIVEGETIEEVRLVDAAELEISLLDRQSGEVVWQGRLLGSYDDTFGPHVSASVVELLDRIPSLERAPLGGPGGASSLAQRPAVGEGEGELRHGLESVAREAR